MADNDAKKDQDETLNQDGAGDGDANQDDTNQDGAGDGDTNQDGAKKKAGKKKKVGKNSTDKKPEIKTIDLDSGKMPNGKLFEVYFVPKDGVNSGLRGFMIHGLERSEFVTKKPQQFDREKLKLILKTVQKKDHQISAKELVCTKIE